MRLLKNLNKRRISLSEVDTLCLELALSTNRERFDCVISIETGGLYPGIKVAQHLGLPHLRVAARRPIKRTLYGFFPRRMRIIPTLWHAAKFVCSDPAMVQGLSPEQEESLRGKRVLVVDDTIQSGKTLIVVKEYLASLGAESKTATLSGTWHHSDYCARRGAYYYPWSARSQEYEQFIELVPHLRKE